MQSLNVIIFIPGRRFPPMFLQRGNWVQCLMVPNIRLHLFYLFWMFLLTRLFQGLVKEATKVPACHRRKLPGTGSKEKTTVCFGAYSSCDVWHPADTIWETDKTSIFSAWYGWGMTQMGGPLTPNTPVVLPPAPTLPPLPLRQCLFSILCSPRLVQRSLLLDE